MATGKIEDMGIYAPFVSPPVYQYDKVLIISRNPTRAEAHFGKILQDHNYGSRNEWCHIAAAKTEPDGFFPSYRKYAALHFARLSAIPTLYSEIRRVSRAYVYVESMDEALDIALSEQLVSLKTALDISASKVPAWGKRAELILLIFSTKCGHCDIPQVVKRAFPEIVMLRPEGVKKPLRCKQRCLRISEFGEGELFSPRIESDIPIIEEVLDGENPVDFAHHRVAEIQIGKRRIDLDELIGALCQGTNMNKVICNQRAYNSLAALDRLCDLRLFDGTRKVTDYPLYLESVECIHAAVSGLQETAQRFGKNLQLGIQRIKLDDICHHASDRDSQLFREVVSDTLEEMSRVDILRWHPDKATCVVPMMTSDIFSNCEMTLSRDSILRYIVEDPEAKWSAAALKKIGTKNSQKEHHIGLYYSKQNAKFLINYQLLQNKDDDHHRFNLKVVFDLGGRVTPEELDDLVDKKKPKRRAPEPELHFFDDLGKAWNSARATYLLFSDVRRGMERAEITIEQVQIHEMRDSRYKVEISKLHPGKRAYVRFRRSARQGITMFAAMMALHFG